MNLKNLSEIYGVSGDEEKVRDYIKKQIEDKVDSITVDRMGNLIANKKGNGKKLILTAHMDEVGLMVTNINDDGTLSFDKVGGVDPRVVMGKVVSVGENDVRGVIGFKAIHLQDDISKTPKYSELRIDIGKKDKKSSEELVNLGDYVSFTTKAEFFGNHFMGKALDDRVGCSVLMDIIDKKVKTDFDVYFCFAVQEEPGLRGSKILSEKIRPDAAIAFECTTAGDNPELPEYKWATHAGDGPVVTFYHRGLITDEKVFDSIVNTAEKHEIKFQYKRRSAGGTDARSITKSIGGVPSGVISVPGRYIHSPLSMIDMNDYKNTVLLVEKILEDGLQLGRD